MVGGPAEAAASSVQLGLNQVNGNPGAIGTAIANTTAWWNKANQGTECPSNVSEGIVTCNAGWLFGCVVGGQLGAGGCSPGQLASQQQFIDHLCANNSHISCQKASAGSWFAASMQSGLSSGLAFDFPGLGGDIAAEGDEVAAAADEGLAITCGGESFTANTQVLLSDGKAKAIDRLKPGEKILATDTKTGKNHVEKVEAVLVHHDNNLYDLRVTSGGRHQVIRTTRNHLFFDSVTRTWVAAAALRKGEELRAPNGTAEYAAGGYVPQDHAAWMWDISVSPSHDFYVIPFASSHGPVTPVLVHNAAPICRHSNEIGAQADSRFGQILSRFYQTPEIESQFQIWTPYDWREADYAVPNADGGYDLFEVKSNTSSYTYAQRQKDAWIANNLGWQTTVVRLSQQCPVC